MKKSDKRASRVFCFVAALYLFSFPCGASALYQKKTPDKPTQAEKEQNIREAVFRYMFDHNASGQQKRAGVYCLSLSYLDPVDPTDEFMKRFSGHKPPVRKISECILHSFEGVTDKLTGKAGLIFRVTEIRWISADEVEVTGGYYEAGLSASGNTYRVAKQQGKWKVIEDKMNWIS
jgi:hypothetical protein